MMFLLGYVKVLNNDEKVSFICLLIRIKTIPYQSIHKRLHVNRLPIVCKIADVSTETYKSLT